MAHLNSGILMVDSGRLASSGGGVCDTAPGDGTLYFTAAVNS